MEVFLSAKDLYSELKCATRGMSYNKSTDEKWEFLIRKLVFGGAHSSKSEDLHLVGSSGKHRLMTHFVLCIDVCLTSRWLLVLRMLPLAWAFRRVQLRTAAGHGERLG